MMPPSTHLFAFSNVAGVSVPAQGMIYNCDPLPN